MSSTYRFLCLAHDPAILVGDRLETQSRDEAVGMLQRRRQGDDVAGAFTEHHGCKILIGRFSYPLVELFNSDTGGYWIGIDEIRLLAAARAAGVSEAVLEPFTRRGWDAETLHRIRHYLETS